MNHIRNLLKFILVLFVVLVGIFIWPLYVGYWIDEFDNVITAIIAVALASVNFMLMTYLLTFLFGIFFGG